ncbi:MAG TPA: VWA domain-containing protein, partial [Planctomycetes bacterium]|nr:VWA domain-containing protein [Planctomycetota bacterium]
MLLWVRSGDTSEHRPDTFVGLERTARQETPPPNSVPQPEEVIEEPDLSGLGYADGSSHPIRTQALQSLGYVSGPVAPGPSGPTAPGALRPQTGAGPIGLGGASSVHTRKATRRYRGPGDVSTPAVDPSAGFFLGAPEIPDRVHDDLSREGYDHIPENDFLTVESAPLSTFSIDVDTASYANVRRYLRSGHLPPADAVRIEELLNYFSYDDPAPTGEVPFSVTTEVGRAPWNEEHLLLRVGLKGRSITDLPDRPRNLTFLIDVSGSMETADKLPLLKRAMRLLVDQLGPRDRVAIVVYAGSSGLVLPSTACSEKAAILESLDRLEAGGSTAGAAGIQLAYRVAREHYADGGINRVILATDGDFNVGVSDEGSLVRLIEKERADGISLSVLGFGTGNLQDSKMEQLADHGNGNYAYIDSLREAQKVLVHELGGTLETIAKDVKIQVEFNPAEVAGYRLIGYENRVLAAEDFNDDTKDAGEIGAGHSVTALYELVPAGMSVGRPGVDPLKYQQASEPEEGFPSAFHGELLTVKLRYKDPQGTKSKKLEFPVEATDASFDDASEDLRF